MGTILPPAWLAATVFEAERIPALYPYAQLRNIATQADVATAVKDECEPLEQEFGVDIVAPFYRLIWELNTLGALFTTHCNIAPADYRPPFEWARTQVAAQLLCLSRNRFAHTDRTTTDKLGHWLGDMLIKGPPTPKDTDGWLITIGTTPYTLLFLKVPDAPYPYRDDDFVETPGYGVVLRIRGCANSRAIAAQRWSRAVNFVADKLSYAKDHDGVTRAEPHKHYQGK